MANRIKELLADRGMTQKDLAKATGVAESQISVICNGSGCHIRTAHKLAGALRVTVDELFPADTEAA